MLISPTFFRRRCSTLHFRARGKSPYGGVISRTPLPLRQLLQHATPRLMILNSHSGYAESALALLFGHCGAYKADWKFLEGACVVEPTLVVVGLNHRTAAVEIRERFWMSGCRQAEVLSMLSQGEGIEEVLVFSTCNRTEFVVWGDATLAVNSILRLLTAEYDLKLQEWNSFYRLLDEQALAHAFRVSCGLDSMCIGEQQIARQVSVAWQQARNAGLHRPTPGCGTSQSAVGASPRAQGNAARAPISFPQPTPHCNWRNRSSGRWLPGPSSCWARAVWQKQQPARSIDEEHRFV